MPDPLKKGQPDFFRGGKKTSGSAGSQITKVTKYVKVDMSNGKGTTSRSYGDPEATKPTPEKQKKTPAGSKHEKIRKLLTHLVGVKDAREKGAGVRSVKK